MSVNKELSQRLVSESSVAFHGGGGGGDQALLSLRGSTSVSAFSLRGSSGAGGGVSSVSSQHVDLKDVLATLAKSKHPRTRFMACAWYAYAQHVAFLNDSADFF